MSENTVPLTIVEHAVRATPEAVARRVRGLSDRAIAWLFISPAILLLLAINIFPLVWTIRLSFTNFRANRPNAKILGLGIANYVSVLTDPDVWAAMQSTAHFLFWTILLQTLIGFSLAWLVDRRFRGHGFWTTVILVPMMLSPAVVGNFWTFLYQPQIGLWNCGAVPHRRPGRIVQHDRLGQARALGDRRGRHLDVDAVRDAHLPRRLALDPRLHLRGCRSGPRLALAPVLDHHAADGAALHHAL